MDNEPHEEPLEEEQLIPEEEQVPFVPSPVSRRIWAWMGVVYMVIIICLITYWIGTNSFIRGITGIMLFPLLGALSAQGFNNYRLCKLGERGGRPALLIVTAIIMGLLTILSLLWGIAEAVTFFGG